MSQVLHLTEDYTAEAADWIATRIVAHQAQSEKPFSLSLCGGGTPKPIYAALAEREDIDWSRVLLTFGDERCVPPDHADSNYRMVKEHLLDAADVPARNVLRMEGERDAEEAARQYESLLKTFAAEADQPVFRHDLILLGMGDDGHTASLFPGTTALEERERWVVGNYVPKFDTHRITVTYPLIEAAKEVAFLTTGDSKKPVAERIWSGESDDPAGKVQTKSGAVWWLVGW